MVDEKKEEPPPLKPRIRDAIRAAVARHPSRLQDQAVFWTIRTVIEATKTLGFPVVVSLLLLWGGYRFADKWIEAQREILAGSNAAQIAAQDRTTAALKDMAAEQADSNEITRSLMIDLGLRPPPKRVKKVKP